MVLVYLVLIAAGALLFLVLLPVLYALWSLRSLFVYPRQLTSMFGNKILRRNHALEHATIAVMREVEPGRALSGYSTDEGFFVRGARSLGEVEFAAREALARLKVGERRLAIHRDCGTTIAAANLVSAVSFLILLGVGLYVGWNVYLLLLASAGISLLLRVLVSLLLQRYVTTEQDLTNAEVGWVEPSNPLEDGRGDFLDALLSLGAVRVRVFHVDPEAVEVMREDGTVVPLR